VNENYKDVIKRLDERFKNGSMSESLSASYEAEIAGARCEPASSGGVPRTGVVNYPPPTSRGVANRNENELPDDILPENELIRGGFDGGVEVGFDGNWQDLQDFREFKELADKLKSESTEEQSYVYMYYRGFCFSLWLRGSSGSVRYKYVFDFDGVRIYLHNNPAGSIQPLRVHYNAVGLIGVDFYKKHASIRKLVELLGFKISQEKISRVDLQVMLNYSMRLVSSAFVENRIVCRARDARYYSSGIGYDFNSFSFGTDLKIRIYDKLLELKKIMLSDPLKFALMIKFCVGGCFFSPEFELMRVEFSLNRSVLKDFGINSVLELHQNENSLVRYCTESWFRVLKEQKNNSGHSATQEVAEWWQQVQSEFSRWFPGNCGQDLVRNTSRNLEVLNCTPDHLDTQAVGCLASSFALRFGLKRSGEFYDLFVSWFQDNFGEVYKRYVERCKVLSVARLKQGELEHENYDEAMDPRVVNEIAWRLRNREF
jgi:hypothetical protein